MPPSDPGASLLPRVDLAVVELRKLVDYCLNPVHPRGRHKARVFQAALGVGQAEAEWLRDAILAGIAKAPIVLESRDQHGGRYRADLTLAKGNMSAAVRTIWLLPSGAAPRLITCYVL